MNVLKNILNVFGKKILFTFNIKIKKPLRGYYPKYY